MNKKQETSAEDIGARLSEAATAPAAAQSDAPQTAEPAPALDITKLSVDQLQALKAQLEAVPARRLAKGNPTIKLRQLDGKIITDFKNCFTTVQTDKLTNVTSEIIMIPVQFMGSEEFVNVVWRDFMYAEQIVCEVLSEKQIPGRIVQGEVVSKATGQLVEMEVKTVTRLFTVKLPDGGTIELPEHVVNA